MRNMIICNPHKTKLCGKETISVIILVENADGNYQSVLLFKEDIDRIQRKIDLCKAV